MPNSGLGSFCMQPLKGAVIKEFRGKVCMLIQFLMLLYILTAHTFAWTIPTALQFRCRHGFVVGRNGFGLVVLRCAADYQFGKIFFVN
jgi:hypothetical protein